MRLDKFGFRRKFHSFAKLNNNVPLCRASHVSNIQALLPSSCLTIHIMNNVASKNTLKIFKAAVKRESDLVNTYLSYIGFVNGFKTS